MPTKKRHPVRNVLIVAILVVVASVTWLVAVPLHAWSQVQRVDDTPAGQRPPTQPGTTFLLVGSDSREGLIEAEQNKLGTGNEVGQRTDTMMIMYIPPSGRPALISVPRDSYVPIPGNGKNKINAAFAFGGPKLLVRTVEQNTGLRVDGYMEIGFGGFVNIIDALGGISMCIPAAIKDKDSHLDLKKGCQTLDGTTALGYVRMRKADPRGDLGRVERQRQMLAAIAKKAATPATILNPVRYWTLTHAMADSIKVGQDTSLFETASMALAMRKVASGQGLTLTVPVANPNAYTPVGSVGAVGRHQGQGDVRRHRPRRHLRSGQVRQIAPPADSDQSRSVDVVQRPRKNSSHVSEGSVAAREVDQRHTLGVSPASRSSRCTGAIVRSRCGGAP